LCHGPRSGARHGEPARGQALLTRRLDRALTLVECLDLAQIGECVFMLGTRLFELQLQILDRAAQIVAALGRSLGVGRIGEMLRVADASAAISRSSSPESLENSRIISSMRDRLRRFSSTAKRLRRITDPRVFIDGLLLNS